MTIQCPAAERPVVANRLADVARCLDRYGFTVAWPQDGGDYLDVRAGDVAARVSIDEHGTETIVGSDGYQVHTVSRRSGIGDGRVAQQAMSDLCVAWRANHETLPVASGLTLTRRPDLDVLGVLFYQVCAIEDPGTSLGVIVRSNPASMGATSWRAMVHGGADRPFYTALDAARAAMA